MLGFEHEQESPVAPFAIDCADKMLNDAAQKHSVGVENVCDKFTPDNPDVEASVFDAGSVMYYSLPYEMVGPGYSFRRNFYLSPMDILKGSEMYPGRLHKPIAK